MKKNLVFLAGLLFLIAVEIYIVADHWLSQRASPAPIMTRAPSK